MHRSTLRKVSAAALTLAFGTLALAAGRAVVKPKADIPWTPGAIPGVSTAVVDGDMAKGASHFYLKYAAGLATPMHHHTADHYVTTLSGTLVLKANGNAVKLAPGSFFELTGKAPHAATCEGTEDCVMFVDARAAWDVVPESKP